MFSLLFGLLAVALRLASYVLLAYCIMSFIMPQSDLYRKLGYYVERFLYPVRKKLYGWFPSLRNLPVDLSSLALWLAIDILMAVINVFRGAF